MVLLFGRDRFRLHIPWMMVFILGTIGSVAWYAVASWQRGEWLGGSSLPGFTFGIVGAALIVFEFLLWWRKKVRTWRIGRAQTWMLAHIWLGLLTVPLVLLHSGFRLGSPLTTILVALFSVVIVSGVWGLFVQQWIPMRMFRDIPLETIHSQIDRISQRMSENALALVQRACGISESDDPMESSAATSTASLLIVGAGNSAGGFSGRTIHSMFSVDVVSDGQALIEFFLSDVDPYLLGGAKSGSLLRDPEHARRVFADVKSRMDKAAHPVIDQFAELCEERRQLDRQRTMHFWLHNWLVLHLPLSVALVMLLAVHIWVALKYW